MAKLRVIHFGSGGGKGVTRVLTDLAQGHAARGAYEPLIVYRRKRGKPLGEAFRRDLAASGVAFREVSPRPQVRTIAELRAIIREFRPDVFVAHGYSEHLTGRVAAIAEGVPVVVQGEHNIEHYKWLHLRKARQLAAHTDAIVGVSRGVVARLAELGLPREKLHVIYNGVRLERFSGGTRVPWADREPAVIMASRFGRQKDQSTLLRAAALLRARGCPVRVRLAGGGKKWNALLARCLARWLGVSDLVEFLGPRNDLPALFQCHRVAVLSTHSEGFGLVVIEGMASGCASVGSRVVGVEELIEPGRTGWLVEPHDPEALADAIVEALGPQGEARAAAARDYACAGFGVERMVAEYEQLFDGLLAAKRGERVCRVAGRAGD